MQEGGVLHTFKALVRTLLKGTTSRGASGLPFWELAAAAAPSRVAISTKALALLFFLLCCRMTMSLTAPCLSKISSSFPAV